MKLRILLKTLTYIGEEVWIGLGVGLYVIASILLGIFLPLIPSDFFFCIKLFAFIFNVLAWAIIIIASFGIICFLGYCVYQLYNGILYVFDDIKESYDIAKKEIEKEDTKEEQK